MNDTTCSPLIGNLGPGECFNNTNCTSLWMCKQIMNDEPCRKKFFDCHTNDD